MNDVCRQIFCCRDFPNAGNNALDYFATIEFLPPFENFLYMYKVCPF